VADYYRDLVRLLKNAGYQLKRQGRGDHEIWWNPSTGGHVTVDRKLRSRNTANAILKEANLPKAF
jgi:predicted RNA binding protein YcfA (HicA-like mRNA interferase family)